MIPVFENPADAEIKVKQKFSFPPFIMMENAARSFAQEILKEWNSGNKNYEKVIFLCGKGNNGADGLAAARMLYGKLPVSIFCPDFPKTEEGLVQTKMCQALNITFLSQKQLLKSISEKSPKIIADCIFGTGFHGEIPEIWKTILDSANISDSFRIACDISSGLYFCAHKTVTMGTLKTLLFSDKAKEVSGEITVSELGISSTIFEAASKKDSNIFLLEEKDIKLPLRNKENTHKGTYGHSIIFAGEKSGAAIMSAEAAMKFGSGLTSLLEFNFSNLKQFKISPELMICSKIPKTAKALQIGSGLGNSENPEIQKAINDFQSWFLNEKNPAAVIDADMFSYKELTKLLDSLKKVKDGRIVLTPHAKELSNLTGISSPAVALENRIQIGRDFTKKYPNVTLVMKGANTYIAEKGKIFIYNGGSPSLAKGGSGDVLAGMITALLAQGYTGLEAAITAVFHHGNCAKKTGTKNYNLTPKKLINLI